jgi:hypothetical protein
VATELFSSRSLFAVLKKTDIYLHVGALKVSEVFGHGGLFFKDFVKLISGSSNDDCAARDVPEFL